MNGYGTLKKFIYISETLVGFLFILLAWEMSKAAGLVCHTVICHIPAAILIATGTAGILFGINALLLRDDPDIRR